jgi:predicted dithiol-disulfide oxidoreductase (DUF899 family)
MQHTNLSGESQDYMARREELRLAEIELMRNREQVAALRRALPECPVIEDYEFLSGPSDLDSDVPVRSVRLSELFSGPGRTLVIYHLMYGKRQTSPCPMCTMWRTPPRLAAVSCTCQDTAYSPQVALQTPRLGPPRSVVRARSRPSARR